MVSESVQRSINSGQQTRSSPAKSLSFDEGTVMPQTGRKELQKKIMEQAVPAAMTDVPITNQAIARYAHNVLKAGTSRDAYWKAYHKVKQLFNVDLIQAEKHREGVKTITLNEANAKVVQDILIGEYKGLARTELAQTKGNLSKEKIARAIPVEVVPNQKLINYAFDDLKVSENRSAERHFENIFQVNLDFLLENPRGTSTIEVNGGNEAALKEVLDQRAAKASGATGPQMKRSEPPQPREAELKRDKTKAHPAQSVTGKEIARLYEKTADALTEVFGGGRAGHAAAAQFLGAKGTSDRALEEAIAQKVGARYIASGYEPASLRGDYRNSQFGVDRYHIGAMTQDLQRLVTTAVKQRDAAAHEIAREKTPERDHAKLAPQRDLGREEFVARTVVEPGRQLFKRVQDTIFDMHGQPVVSVERTRMNLGPLSFNLPGGRYNVTRGVPVEQAKDLARYHINQVSRRH